VALPCEPRLRYGASRPGLRRHPHRGAQRTGLWGHISAAAYNLLRLAKLLPREAPAWGWRRPHLERAASREASRGPAER